MGPEWAGGLYSGEGSTYIHRKKATPKNIYVVLSLTMTDEWSMRQFAEIVGEGRVSGPYRKVLPRKDVWRWQVESVKGVNRIVDLLWDFLSPEKQNQIVRCRARKEEHDVKG